jgi:hypothetical protein
MIIQHQQEVPDKARRFMTSHSPIFNCIEKHYSRSLDSFGEKVTELAYSTYGKKICQGRGSSCGIGN